MKGPPAVVDVCHWKVCAEPKAPMFIPRVTGAFWQIFVALKVAVPDTGGVEHAGGENSYAPISGLFVGVEPILRGALLISVSIPT